jgi:hypothetical protein
MYCNNNHRIILCMIIINYFRAKHFREAVVRGTCNSSKVIFEQLTFEQLISSNSSSSNCIRAIYLDSWLTAYRESVKLVVKYCPQLQTCSCSSNTLSMLFWNRFMEQVTSGLDFFRSRIIFLSFIRAPPTDYDTMFISHFEKTCERSKGHFQKICSLLLINHCSLKPEILLRVTNILS